MTPALRAGMISLRIDDGRWRGHDITLVVAASRESNRAAIPATFEAIDVTCCTRRRIFATRHGGTAAVMQPRKRRVIPSSRRSQWPRAVQM